MVLGVPMAYYVTKRHSGGISLLVLVKWKYQNQTHLNEILLKHVQYVSL